MVISSEREESEPRFYFYPPTTFKGIHTRRRELEIAAKNSVSQRVLDKAHSCVRAVRVAACARLEIALEIVSAHEQERLGAISPKVPVVTRERPRAT